MKQALRIGLLICFSLQARAQYSFTKGSCVLRDGRQLTGSLRLEFPTAQAASALHYYDGKQEEEFTPELVRNCTLGKHSFIVARNFVAPDDHGGIPVDQDFVEVVDTAGSVQLFSYCYEAYIDPSWTGGAPTMMAGGRMTGGMGTAGGYAKKRIMVLRKAGSQQFVPYTAGEKKTLLKLNNDKSPTDADVAATVAFFPNDPALQDLILKGKLASSQLLATVQAYNGGAKKALR
jgi:hypothetical protein